MSLLLRCTTRGLLFFSGVMLNNLLSKSTTSHLNIQISPHLAPESGRQWWLMGEFAACLDRDTAKIIAFNLQKIARQQGKAVIAATTHNELLLDLAPSVLVQRGSGRRYESTIIRMRKRWIAASHRRCELMLALLGIGEASAISIIEGTKQPYNAEYSG
jgi:hypothetical protein